MTAHRGWNAVFILSGTSLYLGYGGAAPGEAAVQTITGFFQEHGYAAELYLWKQGEGSWSLCEFLARSHTLENYGFYEKIRQSL